MFSTRFGTRSLVNVYKPTERTNYFTLPAPGQVVSLHSGATTLAAGVKKPRKGKTALTIADVNAGKLRPACADGSGAGMVEGVIVRVAAGGDVSVAANGEEIPIGLFGPLATLTTFGDTNILYLSHEVPGALTPLAPPSGYWLRRVIRCPKYFSKLVDADVNPDSPTQIYVRIIEEAAQII
ncbi:hypothetical protein [Haliangium sp. UPWRP_2]|uniref:hypothetical protein n=1 Tax=Haliangium sp. UPWRP_2 TaxID=1931276 RepID=UPI0011B1CCBD|nr:hypothetical protein [Haliangium sp. UPWRP_2]